MSTNEPAKESEKKPSKEEIEQAFKNYLFVLYELEARYQIALKALLSFPSRIDKVTIEHTFDGQTVNSIMQFFKDGKEVIPSEFFIEDKDAEIADLKKQLKWYKALASI